MSFKIISSLLFISLFGLTGCFFSGTSGEEIEGNGDIIEETLAQDSFTGIHINGVFDVALHLGENHSVMLTGDENLIKEIKVEIKDDVLHVNSKKNLKASKELRIDIYMEEIKDITLAGAANLNSDKTLENEELDLKVSGAGNVDLDVETETLDIAISGAGNLKIAGSADESEIKISGAGNMEAFELKTHTTHLDMSGAGNVEVYADETLDIKLSGIGRVVYKGSPSTLNKKVSGLGVVSEG